MWATDASYFRVVGWGYYYLVTVSIKHILATPFHPRANGKLERYHQTSIRLLTSRLAKCPLLLVANNSYAPRTSPSLMTTHLPVYYLWDHCNWPPSFGNQYTSLCLSEKGIRVARMFICPRLSERASSRRKIALVTWILLELANSD